MKKLMTAFAIIGAVWGGAISARAADTPESHEGITLVDATKAKELKEKGVPIFDVRVANEYAEEHIAGAISLPYKEKSKKEANYDASLDSFDDSKLPAKGMIFQCNGKECWKSFKASLWALKKGKKEVYWLRGGIPEWKAKGYPTTH